MPRMIDQMREAQELACPRVVKQVVQWKAYTAMLTKIVRSRDVFVASIDPVSDYYFFGTDRENWNLGNKDHFPTLVPPRPLMWFEHRFPESLESEKYGHFDVKKERYGDGRAGTLMLHCRREDVTGEHIPGNTKTVLVIDTFMNYGSARPGIEGPHGAWTLALDDAGELIGNPWCQSFAGNDRQAQHIVQLSQSWIHPPLLALSWMPRELTDEQMEIAL